jgi:hypothetical protein
MYETLINAPWVVQACAVALTVLVVSFLGYFLPMAVYRWYTLRKIIKGLRAFSGRSAEKPTHLFEKPADLSHLWAEFSDTLFEETVFNATTGAHERAQYRATVPAEQYFHPQVVVDSRVGGEFFKHLPGILTGIGIIGTFAGLLRGLKNFQITENAQVVRDSLGVLLHSVSEAFLVSATAILAAIAITVVEKLVLAVLYRQTEEMSFLLDGLYKAGAGEQMLSRLVESSEDAVATSKVLKDALVQELSGVLRELTDNQIRMQKESTERQIQMQQESTEKQIEAQKEASAQLGADIGAQIGEKIAAGLAEPIQEMTKALDRVATGGEKGVEKLLTDVVSNLSQKLEDLFGNQIAGINDMQKQTITALESAVGKMAEMSTQLESAGTRGAEQMAAKLGEAVEKMATRQELMGDHMAKIVEEMKASVAQGQTETNKELAQAVANIGVAVEGMVQKLSEQSAQAEAGHAERQRQLATDAQTSLAGVNGTVETLSAHVDSLVKEVRATLERMSGVTDTIVRKMNDGAETMYAAASEFKTAGTAVTGVLRETSGVAEKLTGAANSLGTATQSLQGIVTDYRTTRDQLSSMSAELARIVDSAKREASVTADVLERIEDSAQALRDAHIDAQKFADGVAKVLGDSSVAFKQNLTDNMTAIYKEMHTRTFKVTELLGQTVHNLAKRIELVVPNPALER